jgi:hypothetical protein
MAFRFLAVDRPGFVIGEGEHTLHQVASVVADVVQAAAGLIGESDDGTPFLSVLVGRRNGWEASANIDILPVYPVESRWVGGSCKTWREGAD